MREGEGIRDKGKDLGAQEKGAAGYKSPTGSQLNGSTGDRRRAEEGSGMTSASWSEDGWQVESSSRRIVCSRVRPSGWGSDLKSLLGFSIQLEAIFLLVPLNEGGRTGPACHVRDAHGGSDRFTIMIRVRFQRANVTIPFGSLRRVGRRGKLRGSWSPVMGKGQGTMCSQKYESVIALRRAPWAEPEGYVPGCDGKCLCWHKMRSLRKRPKALPFKVMQN